MTREELGARCKQAYNQLMTFDIPTTHEASEALYIRNMTILKSLCREMLAAGLERATEGLKVDNTKLRWALKELGPTNLKCEAYVKAAVEHVIWAREEAQRVKENHDTKKTGQI